CPSSGWVFPSDKTNEGHRKTIAKQFEQARRLAGLPAEVVLYCARHSFGTLAMSETGDPKAVMDVMGHQDFKTTMGYLHPGMDRIRDAVNARNDRNSAETVVVQ